MERDLRAFHQLYNDLLQLVRAESRAIQEKGSEGLQRSLEEKKSLLPRLNQSLDRLHQYRRLWKEFTAEERRRFPGIRAWLRKNQDMIMKVIVLDRENEQGLLRRGQLPVGQTPSYRSQRPHWVARMYRRQQRS